MAMRGGNLWNFDAYIKPAYFPLNIQTSLAEATHE